MKDADDEGAVNTGSNLFVTGIHPRLSESDVSRLFDKYGEVENCSIMLDPHTKESRGFGFVKMVTAEQADAAKEGLQGEVIEGRTLSIEKARRARPRTPTPGKYFGPPKRGKSKIFSLVACLTFQKGILVLLVGAAVVVSTDTTTVVGVAAATEADAMTTVVAPGMTLTTVANMEADVIVTRDTVVLETLIAMQALLAMIVTVVVAMTDVVVAAAAVTMIVAMTGVDMMLLPVGMNLVSLTVVVVEITALVTIATPDKFCLSLPQAKYGNSCRPSLSFSVFEVVTQAWCLFSIPLLYPRSLFTMLDRRCLKNRASAMTN
jgi:RNA recognition motif. (a.k.a. RRM, RBD, or RNP domain)